MSHNKYKFLIGAAVTAMSISLFAQTAPPATTCGNGVIDQGETCDLGTVNGVNNNDGTKGCSSSCQTMTAQGWKCVNSSDADYAQKITNTVTDPFTAPATTPLSFADLWKVLTDNTHAPVANDTHMYLSSTSSFCGSQITSASPALCQQYLLDINKFKDINSSIKVTQIIPTATGTCTQGTTKISPFYDLNTKQLVADYIVNC